MKSETWEYLKSTWTAIPLIMVFWGTLVPDRLEVSEDKVLLHKKYIKGSLT